MEVKRLRLQPETLWLEVKRLRSQPKALWVEGKRLRLQPETLRVEGKRLRLQPETLWLEGKPLRSQPKTLWPEGKRLRLQLETLQVEAKTIPVDTKTRSFRGDRKGVERERPRVRSSPRPYLLMVTSYACNADALSGERRGAENPLRSRGSTWPSEKVKPTYDFRVHSNSV